MDTENTEIVKDFYQLNQINLRLFFRKHFLKLRVLRASVVNPIFINSDFPRRKYCSGRANF